MYIKTKTKTYNVKEQTLVIDILNITPDSFSDGGNYTSIDKAIKHALEMEEQGAHIIDVGCESSRPDHDPVSDEEEIGRVVPVIKALKERLSIPISIDTYKASTAEAAIVAGAEIINDIWRSEEHTSELQSRFDLVCRLLLEKKKESTREDPERYSIAPPASTTPGGGQRRRAPNA